MNPFTPYMVWIKVGGVVLIFAGGYLFGGSNAKARCERTFLAKESKALTAAVAERDRAIADRNEAQRKADRLAKLPAKVIERVRTNPSRCVLPAPVADGLREQGDEIDAAIREVQ